MNKLYFILFLFFGFSAIAQQPAPVRPTLGETSVVKDSSGFQYPYAIWKKLWQGGSHAIRPMQANGVAPEFLIYELSEADKIKRAELMPKPGETSFFKTGSKLPNFKMLDIEGKKYNLKDLAGKVVVLNFWFINCPPCRMEIPDLNKMVLKYKDNPDVIFLAVGLDEKYDIKDFLKKSPFLYNISADGRWLANSYGVKSYPTHVVIDQTAKILFHTTGLAVNTVYWVDKSIREALGAGVSGGSIGK